MYIYFIGFLILFFLYIFPISDESIMYFICDYYRHSPINSGNDISVAKSNLASLIKFLILYSIRLIPYFIISCFKLLLIDKCNSFSSLTWLKLGITELWKLLLNFLRFENRLKILLQDHIRIFFSSALS